MNNRRNPSRILLASFVCATIVVSCAGSRFVRDGERLYAGAEVAVVASGAGVDKKAVEKTALEAVLVKPNNRFFGLYPELWFYSLAPDSAHKGFFAWLKKKAGAPPVRLTDVNPAATAKIIDARLFNIGIFNSATTFTVVGDTFSATVRYSCNVHPPFRIRSLSYPGGTDSLSARIAALAPSSLVRIDGPYDLSILKLERERIDSSLKENGYFNFNPDYLLFTADSGGPPRTVALRLALKNDAPAESRMTYRIRAITIDPSYSMERDSTGAAPDTTMVDSVIFIGKSTIRSSVIVRACAFRRNRLYSRRQHQRTLNRIMSMGNFKYAAIQYAAGDSAGAGFLDVKILLTPLEQQSLRSELTLVSKSNDFIGPKLDLNYSNKNTFGGAELFNLSLGASAETQFVGGNKNLYSYELNPKVDLTIPRFVVPFFPKTPRGAYVPRTTFSSGYSYVSRPNFFDSKSLLFTYGFGWRQNLKTAHMLNPVTINYLSLFNKSRQFMDSLKNNPYLAQSYQEKFIAGSYYSYTYSEQIATKQTNQFSLSASVESAGNALSIAEKLFTGKTASSDHPLTLAGSEYSQFLRIALDARNITNFSPSMKLVTRVYAGAGKAYGNSSTLPYSKQFFCGGPMSVRAFQIHSVGPGTSEPQTRAAFLEPGGDLKLEANAEYRFPIVGFLKGAAFLDAGNTWLLRRAEGINSQAFALDRFYREYALGGGAGLRLDLSFFILRFDLGVPLREPWRAPSERWVVDRVDFASPSWRNDNLVWNIAIGYPF